MNYGFETNYSFRCVEGFDRRRSLLGTRCLGFVAWLPAPFIAHIGGATRSRVADQAGAAVPGATVTVTAVGTALTRTAVTGTDGSYAFPAFRQASIVCVSS